jgi:hypothetical protein
LKPGLRRRRAGFPRDNHRRPFKRFPGCFRPEIRSGVIDLHKNKHSMGYHAAVQPLPAG